MNRDALGKFAKANNLDADPEVLNHPEVRRLYASEIQKFKGPFKEYEGSQRNLSLWMMSGPQTMAS